MRRGKKEKKAEKGKGDHKGDQYKGCKHPVRQHKQQVIIMISHPQY
jgi:hypothetical protein